MFTLMTLGGLLVAGLVVMLAIGALLFVLKVVVTLVLLPFRLLFGLVFGLIGGLFSLLCLPLFLVGGLLVGVVALVGGLFALLTPLLPLAAIAFLVWAVARSRRPTVHPVS